MLILMIMFPSFFLTMFLLSLLWGTIGAIFSTAQTVSEKYMDKPEEPVKEEEEEEEVFLTDEEKLVKHQKHMEYVKEHNSLKSLL